MLDTNIVSELARRPRGPVGQKINEVKSDQVCISIITAAELRFGVEKKKSEKLRHQIEAILEAIKVQPFEEPADIAYGEIRARLEAKGTLIGPNDLLLAAHARASNAVFVTANQREFERVPGLTAENWLAP
jgi:tRNA(fMet)-specific endonuclease VapC